MKLGGKLSFWQGFIYSYPAFLVWNAATTWWVWNSTPPGSIAMMVLNAAFMALVFAFWHTLRHQNPPRVVEPIAFISFWMSWEFLHLHWDLTWPWLNLGNVFGNCPQYVQWYEFTGTFGGTLWILGTNFLLYYLIISMRETSHKRWKWLLASACWIILPMILSILMYHHYSKPQSGESVEVVVVQQNTDPWEEQYEMSNLQHSVRLLQVAFSKVTDQTQLIVCSESAIPHTISSQTLLNREYEPMGYNYGAFTLLDSLCFHYPNINVITGISTFTAYDYKATETARDKGNNYFIDMFNSSICYNKNGVAGMYHKSKLVPGVEKMPFPKLFGFLEKLVIDLGGPSGSLGIDSCQRAFVTTINNGTCKIGAPICYESIYGELFGRFVLDGAQLMTVITNDSWWKNTPGHKQHCMMARLRAVESRRSIARAANTGTSAFIMPNGDIHQATMYETRTAIRENLYLNNKITFYVKHGDYLAHIAVGFATAAFLFGIVLFCTRKRRKI